MYTKRFAFLFYLLLSIIFIGIPLRFNFISYIHTSPDPVFYIWSLKWWPYAISHGLNPFLTKVFWAPYGQNLAWATAVPSIALLFWPITSFFGPICSYNVSTVLSVALGAFGIYLICKELTLKQISSIFAGIIFFFSSYVWGQLLGHLNLDVIFAIPFLIYLFISRFDNSISNKKYIFYSSILLVFQFGVSNEIYATFIFFSFIALFILFLLFINNKEYKNNILKTSSEALLAIVGSVILLTPYLYYVFNGYISQSIEDISFYSADPINFIIPTPIVMLFGKMFTFISTNFCGNFSETGAYLGIPLIFIIFTFGLKKWRENKCYRFLIILFLAVLVFSFGPYLNVLNHKIINMPWYYIFLKMPLIHQSLPTRFTLYTSILSAIIAALWLEKTNYSKRFKYVVAFLAVLFLIPNLNSDMYKGHKIKYPEFISKEIYKNYIKPGENVIVFPTYRNDGIQAQLWQQKTDFYFNLSQQIAGLPPEQLVSDTMLHKMWEPFPADFTPIYKVAFYEYIMRCNVKAILLPADIKNIFVEKLLGSLHVKPVEIGGVVLYKINSEEYNKAALDKLKAEYMQYILDDFTTLFFSSQKFLEDGNNISNLFPKYLEEHKYLDKSFGYMQEKPAINWMPDGGWIGQWECKDGNGTCFGVGVIDDVEYLKPIINKYESQAVEIFFPYPKIYDPNESYKGVSGRVLMIFRTPKSKLAPL